MFTLAPEASVGLAEVRLSDGPRGVRGLKFSGALLPRMPPSESLYVFMEVDFMDAPEPPPLQIRYQKMVDPQYGFVENAAQQIVATIAETLRAPQSDAELDAANIGAPEA